MDKKVLSDLGLSERETAVYIALLQLGTTTTGPLVKKSEVQNAKIYETLEKLISRGLANYIFKGKIKYFQANNPKVLLDFFEEKRRSLKKRVKELIKLQHRKEAEYEVRVYEGIRAIKSIFYQLYDYIGRNSEYCVFPIGEELVTKELKDFWGQVLLRRIDKNIKIRTLPNIKWKNLFEKNYKKYKLINIRYTRQEFPTGIFIFKDYVLNVVWDEKPVAFLVKSKKNYLKWQSFFNEQWELANS